MNKALRKMFTAIKSADVKRTLEKEAAETKKKCDCWKCERLVQMLTSEEKSPLELFSEYYVEALSMPDRETQATCMIALARLWSEYVTALTYAVFDLNLVNVLEPQIAEDIQEFITEEFEMRKPDIRH